MRKSKFFSISLSHFFILSFFLCTFAAANAKTFGFGLDYGVMVAQQVLVLFDWVRVPVVQLRRSVT